MFNYRFLGILFVVITVLCFLYYSNRNDNPSEIFENTMDENDSEWAYYKKNIGVLEQSKNAIAIVIKDKRIFKLENFNRLRYLTDDLATIKGIKSVISITNITKFVKDTVDNKKVKEKIFRQTLLSQKELDTLLNQARQLTDFNRVANNSGSTAIWLLLEKDSDFKKGKKLFDEIKMSGDFFTQKTEIKLFYVKPTLKIVADDFE